MGSTGQNRIQAGRTQAGLVSAVLALTLWVGSSQSAGASDVPEQASAALRAGQLAKAAELYRVWLEGAPGDVDRLEMTASVLGWAGEHEEALVLYDRLLEIAPQRVNQWQLEKARIWAWQGKLADARAWLETQMIQQPVDPEVGMLLAQVWHWQGDSEGAKELARQLVAEHPDRADAALLLSQLSQANLADYEALSRRFPDHPGVLLALAKAQMNARQWSAAQATLQRHYDLDPGDGQGRLLSSQLLAQFGRGQAALSTVAKLREDQPRLVEASEWHKQLRQRHSPQIRAGAYRYTVFDKTFFQAVETEGRMEVADTAIRAGAALRVSDRPTATRTFSVPSRQLYVGAFRRFGPDWRVDVELGGVHYNGTGLLPTAQALVGWQSVPQWEGALTWWSNQVDQQAGTMFHQGGTEGKLWLWPGGEGAYRFAIAGYSDGNTHWRWGADVKQKVVGALGARVTYQGQRFARFGDNISYETRPFDLFEVAATGDWDAWSASLGAGGYQEAAIPFAPLVRAQGAGRFWLGDHLMFRVGGGATLIGSFFGLDGNLAASWIW